MLESNKIYLGDNLELLKQLDENSIHSIVSDFPYNLGFMGKKWDTITNYYEWCYTRAVESLRVLKPGGYCLIFGGTRTHHRLVCAFEDAGFVIKDEIQWIYGSGFPKSYNISKGFDKKAGAEREVVGESPYASRRPNVMNGDVLMMNKTKWDCTNDLNITLPSTDLAKQWDGWGTALKPAQEPIMVAQKPIEKNYCYNVEKYGVGGLNIDVCRVKFSKNDDPRIGKDYKHNAKAGLEIGSSKENSNGKSQSLHNSEGRFPANIIFDKAAADVLDEQSGILKSGSNCVRSHEGFFLEHGKLGKAGDVQTTYGDIGGASRFFYCAKANKKDKTENSVVNNTHPTVKPTDLIKYLVRLVTPKNGICLDLCEGSGTHAKACIQLTKEDYPVNYIGLENDEESFNISNKRITVNQ